MRIVVLGGRGNFGARICRALSSEPGAQVMAVGRAELDIDSRDFPSAVLAIYFLMVAKPLAVSGI